MLGTAPFPAQGEHVAGYVRRLASANGLTDLRELKSLCGFAALSPTSPSGVWRRLAMATGLAASSIDPLRWPRLGTTRDVWLHVLGRPLRRRHLDIEHFRRCTQCLAENRILRTEWSLRHVTACGRHGSQLVDHCLACGSHLRFENTLAAWSCGNCGFDLAGGRPPPAAEDECVLSDALGRALYGSGDDRGDIAMPDSFLALPIADAAAVTDHLWRFVVATDATDDQSYSRRTPPPRLIEARRQAVAAARLLRAWPDAFRGLVGSLDLAESARTRVGASHRQFAGRGAKRLAKPPTTLSGTPIAFLTDAMKDTLNEIAGHRSGQRAPGSRARPKAMLAQPSSLPPISHADAMLRLEGRPDGRQARWWIDAGLLAEIPTAFGNAVLSTDEVSTLAASIRFVADDDPHDDAVDMDWIDRSVTCRREYDKSAFLKDLLEGRIKAWIVDPDREGLAALSFSRPSILKRAGLAQLAAWIALDAHVAMTRFRQVAVDVWPEIKLPSTASARDIAATGALRFTHYDPPGTGRRQHRWHAGDLVADIQRRSGKIEIPSTCSHGLDRRG